MTRWNYVCICVCKHIVFFMRSLNFFPCDRIKKTGHPRPGHPIPRPGHPIPIPRPGHPRPLRSEIPSHPQTFSDLALKSSTRRFIVESDGFIVCGIRPPLFPFLAGVKNWRVAKRENFHPYFFACRFSASPTYSEIKEKKHTLEKKIYRPLLYNFFLNFPYVARVWAILPLHIFPQTGIFRKKCGKIHTVRTRKIGFFSV